LVQDLLHLARPDLEAGGVDHVLGGIYEEQLRRVVEVADITRVEPTAAQHFLRLFGSIPVGKYHVRPLDADLAPALTIAA